MTPTTSLPALAIGLCISLIAGGGAGWIAASRYQVAPVVVQPQATIISRAPVDPGAPVSRTEARRVAQVWGELDQKEIDALAKALNVLDKTTPLTIFCEEDSKCGDLQLDFDNAFESAHWDTKLERPLIDDTIGIATSSPAIMFAINEATNGRLAVKLIPKTAPFYALAIGKKPGTKSDRLPLPASTNPGIKK